MENWKFALGSILSHKMRSLLTMLGIIIGVASVVVIMALGSGLSESVSGEFVGNQDNISLYYSSQQSDDANSTFLDDTSIASESPIIQEEWLEKVVEEVDGIDQYYVTNQSQATVGNVTQQITNVSLTGANKTFFEVKKYKVLAGRTFEDSDYLNYAKVIMLETKLAKRLFSDNQSALNQVVSVGNSDYLVVGVYEDPEAGSATYGFTSNGNAIMTNAQLAVEFSTKEVESVYVHVEDVLQSTLLGKRAAKLLTELSGVREGSFRIFDLSTILNQLKNITSMMTMIIGSIAGISLLVGGIGVMNIMLVSVTERTREIGLRKALGATRSNILSQFLIEAMLLTLIGGFIGLLLAFLIVTGLSSVLQSMQSISLKPQISINAVLVSMTFSAFIGVVFGILPANKASKLNPIEALRYE